MPAGTSIMRMNTIIMATVTVAMSTTTSIVGAGMTIIMRQQIWQRCGGRGRNWRGCSRL